MITREHVLEAQKLWGDGVVKIGSLKQSRTECEEYASNFLDNRYAFEQGDVLFKPTKCELEQFRPTKSEALSYFIAGDDRECQEDNGFALSNWTEILFDNSNIIINEDIAIAMGNYTFKNEASKIKVEYSFVYKNYGNEIKIILHHSSLPYKI